MSCETSTKQASRASRLNGITSGSSRSALVPSVQATLSPNGTGKKSPAGTAKKSRKRIKNGKVSDHAQALISDGQTEAKEKTEEKLPSNREIKISAAFTPDELQDMTIQLRLQAAAIERHLSGSNSSLRQAGRDDPRPTDWLRLDRKQVNFLADQLVQARRGKGAIDTTSLNRHQLKELWEFSRFEADRALRIIDHLTTTSTQYGGPESPTTEYLIGKHRLAARFFTHLADQVEPILRANKIQG